MPKSGAWRVGEHYGIHVYEGDRPVATFHNADDARHVVRLHNDPDLTEILRSYRRLWEMTLGNQGPPDGPGTPDSRESLEALGTFYRKITEQ